MSNSTTDDNYAIRGHTKSGGLYYLDAEGRYHHPKKPAVCFVRGGVSFYWHGELHRVGKPAVIRGPRSRYRAYYEHGQLHRLDGPALIHRDGTQEWWVRGKRLPDNPAPLQIIMALL